jgi:hypothetical protein
MRPEVPKTHDHEDCRVKLTMAFDRVAALEIALADLITEATHGLRFGDHFERALDRARRLLGGPPA